MTTFQFVWQKLNIVLVQTQKINVHLKIMIFKLERSIAGDIMTMPGLPKKPAAYEVKIGSDGNIQGLF